jgi:hypothetical protein
MSDKDLASQQEFGKLIIADIKDMISARFEAGEGVLLLKKDMTDTEIALAVRNALEASKGKSFIVSESPNLIITEF